jgi:hypothetical protein
MKALKPKEQHEQLLAKVDKEKIVQYLNNGQDQEITIIAVTLARQCDLLVHFQRLWKMRVAELDEKLGTEAYIKSIYENKRSLYKELIKPAPPLSL